MSDGDQPPPYSEAVSSDSETVVETSTNIEINVIQQTIHSNDGLNITNDNATGSRGRRNARNTRRHRRTIEGVPNASNSFSGFLDIVHEQKKQPSGFVTNMTYKVGLFIYFFTNFIYSIVAVAVQKQHLAYHLIYILTSLIGLLFKIFVIIVHVRKYFTRSDDEGEDETQSTPNQIAHREQPREAWTADTQVQHYHRKAKSILDEYVLLSLGEFLIYPILICNLYGLINERGWKFDNGISGFNFLFFLYSMIMDAIYMKLYIIWLVARVVVVSYAKYDELLKPKQVEWKRFFTPLYLTMPLAVTTALTHWFMIGLVGVRIYVDNFTLEKDDINSSVPHTGNYKVAPLTGIMISSTIILPIASWVAYIVINKLWLYEVYSAINQLTTGANRMPPSDPWDEKLLAFFKDPRAYIASLVVIITFIVFTVGAYLPEYNSSDYEVATSARNAVQGLGSCFIIIFLLSNIQAAIATLMIVPCGLPILCMFICYKCLGK